MFGFLCGCVLGKWMGERYIDFVVLPWAAIGIGHVRDFDDAGFLHTQYHLGENMLSVRNECTYVDGSRMNMSGWSIEWGSRWYIDHPF